MRKSPATTMASSITRLTARLSATSHEAVRSLTWLSSSGRAQIRSIAEVTRTPGAARSQSSGKTSKSAGSKGRSPSPFRNTV